jgi:hypothetical protein
VKQPHIRPKARRGATNATGTAVVKIARTTRDRCLAIRRVSSTMTVTITAKTASV